MIIEKDNKENIPKIKEIIKGVDNPIIKDFFKWYNYIEFSYKEKTEMYCFFDDDKTLIGFYYISKNKLNVKLYAICINNLYQKQGYGKKVWQHLLFRAKQLGYKSIIFDSDKRFSGYNFFTKKLKLNPIKKKNDNEYKFKIYLTDYNFMVIQQYE